MLPSIPSGVMKMASPQLTRGESHLFDEVILACHADQSLAMLADADDDETCAVFRPFGRIPLDFIPTLEPFLPIEGAMRHGTQIGRPLRDSPSITHGMNILQNLAGRPRLVSHPGNDVRDVAPETVARTVEYEHPEFMPGSMAARRRQLEFCRRRRTSFVVPGGVGDSTRMAVPAAARVAAAFGAREPPLLRAQN